MNVIGIFDSGIGGLTILGKVRALLPNENYIYLSDNKFLPYGSLSREKIIERVTICKQILVEKGVKAIVVACNTATNVGIGDLRAKDNDLIIVGTEPAIKPCATENLGGKIVVLVTPATSKQDKFIELVAKYSGDNLRGSTASDYPVSNNSEQNNSPQIARILTANSPQASQDKEYNCDISVVPCPHLAQLIESEICNLEAIRPQIYSLLRSLGQVESIVLGCTHYIYLRDMINDYYNFEVKIYDGNDGVARRLEYLLAERNALSESTSMGWVKFIST